MTTERRDSELHDLRIGAEHAEKRAPWQKPSMRRVSAAQAELFAGNTSGDGMFTFS